MHALGQLIARVLIGGLFIVAGIVKTQGQDFYFPYMISIAGMREFTLPLAYVIEIGAAVLLVAGWKTRWAAWILIFYTVILTVFFHGLAGPDDAQYFNKVSHLVKNLGVIGGLVYIGLYGAGPLSVDGFARGRR